MTTNPLATAAPDAGTDLLARDALRIHPADLRVRVCADQVLCPLEPDEHVVSWTTELVWQCSLDGGASQEVVVATARLHTLDLLSTPRPWEVLDAHSGDVAAFTVLLDGDEYDEGLDEELELSMSALGLIIVDRVRVPPEWRGRRFGPLLTAASLRLLPREGMLAACCPAPFEIPREDPKRDAAQASIERLWQKFGFTFWEKGVWVLDLTSRELESTYAALVKTVGVLRGEAAEQPG